MTTESAPKTTTGSSKRSRKKKTTEEKRYIKIQAEAYYLAEKDGFKRDAIEYWLAAEAEVGV